MKVTVAGNGLGAVGRLAVLVNSPHSVGVATMVSVKGCVEVKKRFGGHLTVFPLVVHPAGSTDSIVNSGGNGSTRALKSMQPRGGSIPGHRCVMVKVIGSPTMK